MKKIVILSSLLLCTTLYAQHDKKDLYIKKHLPLLEQNLSSDEYKAFKKSMSLNRKGKLLNQDIDLLKKGSDDKFGVYYQYIATEKTGKAYPINLVGSDGRVMVIEVDGTISFDNTKERTKQSDINSQVEGDFIRSYANEKFKVNDLVAKNGLFIVTSTGCGPCVLAYNDLNDLTKEEEFAGIDFTALYRDSFEKINNYKEGPLFKRFGELDAPWNIFSSDELVKKYNTKYNFKGYPYVFIKKEGEIIYQKYGIKIEEIKKQLRTF